MLEYNVAITNLSNAIFPTLEKLLESLSCSQASLVPLSTFLFELIWNFFFRWSSLDFFLYDRPDRTPTPPPTPHTIMWQVSLYADRSHSCTLTRQRFKYRNSSECLSRNWTLFANAVTISHLCWYCLTLEKGSADVSEILRFIHRLLASFTA